MKSRSRFLRRERMNGIGLDTVFVRKAASSYFSIVFMQQVLALVSSRLDGIRC